MVRMWGVDPKKMCTKHLLGEHVELHMMLGSLKKGKSLKGHIEKGQVEVHNIRKRHGQLVKEMLARGFRHSSPLPKDVRLFRAGRLKIIENEKELARRCKDCRFGK